MWLAVTTREMRRSSRVIKCDGTTAVPATMFEVPEASILQYRTKLNEVVAFSSLSSRNPQITTAATAEVMYTIGMMTCTPTGCMIHHGAIHHGHPVSLCNTPPMFAAMP
jgi:hypothetical protein